MRPARVAWLVLALLLVPSASAVPFLQWGYDAGRTGATPGPGPSHFDLAFEVQLPGERVPWTPPVIIDGSVYVATRAHQPPAGAEPDPNLTEDAIWRVDLDTTAVEAWLELDEPPVQLAADVDTLYVATAAGLAAHPIDGGTPRWNLGEPAGPDGPGGGVHCAPPAVSPQLVLLACTQVTGGPAEARAPGASPQDARVSTGSSGSAPTILHALDPVRGEVAWRWTSDDASRSLDAPVETPPPDPGAVPLTVALDGDTALLVTRAEQATFMGEGPDTAVWRLDATTGEARTYDSSSNEHVGVEEGDQFPLRTMFAPPAVAVDSTLGYDVTDDLTVWERSTGQVYWNYEPAVTCCVTNGAQAIALGTDRVYFTIWDRMYAVAAGERVPDEQRLVWAEDWGGAPTFRSGELLLSQSRLFTARGAVAFATDAVLEAVGAEVGDRLWTYVVPDGHRTPNPVTFGVGEGVWVATTWDGRVIVVGRTAASIVPVMDVSGVYPAVGDEVVVDMSATEPGLLSPRLEFRADWGDGSSTDWGQHSRFNHSYAEAGEHEATFHARNPEGQRSTETVTFHVGGTPPPQPNAIETFMETAFARENQDMTFGVLGVALALGGGLIAVGRRRTKRGRLQRELEAIDRLAGQADTPAELEAMLRERRAHVRGLVADGKLDEGQAQVLERRLDEVQRETRMGEIEELLERLPLGLVRHLREVLADGTVTRFERDSILALVEQDGLVPAEVEAEVRSRIEAWFQRDAGVQA